MEAEIIPMCQNEGIAIVPWAALGGGALMSEDQRKVAENDPKARKTIVDERILHVSAVLEEIASRHGTSPQSVVRPSSDHLDNAYVLHADDALPQALAYLYAQTPYVIPIVGVQTVAHVNSMLDHLKVRLSSEDIRQIHDANPLTPLFPMNFLFNYRGDQPYHLGLTAKDNQQYQMAAMIDSPPKQQPY
jgi:aryl-alcohol dehydrogenase-like predicted oxidoreductase